MEIKFTDFGRCLICLHNPCDCKKEEKSPEEKGSCVSCGQPLIRNGEDFTCKECESRGVMCRCEECCISSQVLV